MTNDVPVTAVICTRNRGAAIARPVAAVLAGRQQAFELLVVDQSDHEDTREALSPFLGDPRIRYILTATRGLSKARNLGVTRARADLIAFTDDDCEPTAEWLSGHLSAAQRWPGPAMFFGPFEANEAALEHGIVPYWIPTHIRVRRSAVRERCLGGFGGNMAITRQAFELAGPFDEKLGRGALFESAEEADFALRLVVHGGYVVEVTGPRVIHHGWVPQDRMHASMRGDFTATGRVFGQLTRRGHAAGLAQAGWVLGQEARMVARHLVTGKRPLGLRRSYWVMSGFGRGLLNV